MAGDVCGSCGVEVVDGAQFCHACGRRLDGAPIDFDIYQNDRTRGRSDGLEPGRQSRRTLLVGVSAVALVVAVGLVVFDWFATSNTPTAEPPPSTTVALNNAEPTASAPDSTGVDALAPVLEPVSSLAWRDGPNIGGLTPVGIVEYDGQVFVFASASRFSAPLVGTGVGLWRSGDGVNWEQAGTVIESPNLVMSVAAESDGLVAVGRNIDGDPATWRSVDGSDWAMTTLPEAPSSSATPIPFMSASGGGVEVIVGLPLPQNSFDVVLTAMQKLTGLSLDEFSLGAESGAGSFIAIISGPFGLPLLSASAEELGLSPEDVNRIENGDGDRPIPSATVWSTSDGLDWRITTVDQLSPSSLAVVDDRFVLSGVGPQGYVSWGSDLGESWQQLGSGRDAASSMASWKQMLIGTQFLGSGDIATSTDGSDWTPIGLPDILPSGIELGGSRLAAGDEGIAATVFTTAIGTAVGTDLPEVILVKDGYTLTANDDGDTNSLVLRQGQDTLITKRIFSNSQAGIVADLGNETVTFVDPQTSEPYVTFTIDELRQLDTAANKGHRYIGPQRLILFSQDAITWTVDDITGPTGAGQAIAGLQVTSIGLIAAITTRPAAPSAPPSASTTQIFIADYPS